MTASIQEKRDKYYIVLNWKQGGKRVQKWVRTDLTVNGNNKRKAEQKRIEVLNEWEDKISCTDYDTLFSDYMKEWLENTKHSVGESTYFSYKNTIYNSICPYFESKKIKLCDLKPFHIQDFYNEKLKNGVSANTIYHYHANIHKALNYAVFTERIKNNPSDKVELPKREKHIADFYTADELKILLEGSKNTPLETVVLLASWFGLRRGEIIGLKWNCVDFENKTISIIGTVTDKGASTSKIKNLKYKQTTKTLSSIRSLPMTDEAVLYLKNLKEDQKKRQQKNKRYNKAWKDFVCVRSNGDLIPLEYVSREFPKLCEKCGLKRLKLHELRHTNISLLIEAGASMKEAQEWAGHSSYSTTADIYSHIQAKSKIKLVKSLEEVLC